MAKMRYSIEVNSTGAKCSNSEFEHLILIVFENGLKCEYEKSSTSHLARKLAEIQYLVDDIYDLTSQHCKNSNSYIKCGKDDNNLDVKMLYSEAGEFIKEIPRREWAKITNRFKKDVKKIFEDYPPLDR